MTSLSTEKAKGIHDFIIKKKVPGTTTTVEIPTRKSVRYLGFTIDNLARGTDHIDQQLTKAHNAYHAMRRMLTNKSLTSRAKVICYQIFVRSLLTYASPIWWNVSASHM